MFHKIRQNFVNWLLKDVHIREGIFGENSVKLTDKIKFDTTVAPTVAGDIGMDTTTGRPQAYISGVAQALAHTGEVGSMQSTLTSVNSSGTTSTGALGYTPKAVFFWGTAFDTDAGVTAYTSCAGAGNAISAGIVEGHFTEDNGGDVNDHNVLSGTGIIGQLLSDASPTAFANLTITAFSSSGVTVSWSATVLNFTGSMLIIGS